MRVQCEVNTYHDYMEGVKKTHDIPIMITNGYNDGIVEIRHKDNYMVVDAEEFISALQRCIVYNRRADN